MLKIHSIGPKLPTTFDCLKVRLNFQVISLYDGYGYFRVNPELVNQIKLGMNKKMARWYEERHW